MDMNPAKRIRATRSRFVEDFPFDLVRLRTGSPQL